MNVFYLDKDPSKAAEYSCDKHVVKMILESAQMLCTAHRVQDGKMVIGKSKTGRKRTTYEHPNSNMDNILYPHWKKRRGANSIHKLLEQNNWKYNNFKEDLNRLDVMLYKYRQEGIELYSDDDLEERKNTIKDLQDAIKVRDEKIIQLKRDNLRFNVLADGLSLEERNQLYEKIELTAKVIKAQRGAYAEAKA